MKRSIAALALLLGNAMISNPVPAKVNMEWVVVADPGNVGELRGSGVGGHGPDRISGAVPYLYQIGKHEVTNGQYIEFLNAVASAGDLHRLYHWQMAGTYGGIERSGYPGHYTYGPKVGDTNWLNKPVNFISFFDALRFANWMHNGQPTGLQDDSTTEDGAYDLSTGTYVVRKPEARVFLPNEDECFKAAYYKAGGESGDYWDYPTQSDTPPISEPPPGGLIPPGSAHYSGVNGAPVGQPYYTTDVGAYVYSPGPYGTFDQAGNMGEWSEGLIGYRRVLCGLPWGSNVWGLLAAFRAYDSPWFEDFHTGFRLASVYDPDPRSLGFWKHQCSDLGFRQVSTEELADYFSEVEARSNAFDECSAIGCQVLVNDERQNQMRSKVEKHLLALWLNVVSNRLPETTPVDLNSLSDANSVGEAIVEIETVLCDPYATRPELETAKDIAEAIPTSIPAAGGGGMIAFSITPSNGNNEIYTMNADGTGLRQLTNRPGRDAGPAWSPGAGRIAFYSHQDASTWSIHVMDADGGNIQRLTNAAGVWDNSPSWSPDGSKIVFERMQGNHSEIWVMDVDGGDQHPIGTVVGGKPEWSPGGAEIVFNSDLAGNYEIYSVNVDGANLQRLTNNSAEDWTPDWSPDASRIVFASNRNGNFDIFVMNADGSDPQRLTNSSADDLRPDWSPDGSRIAFVSMRDGNYEVYVMNADGSEQQRSTYTNGHAIQPDWRPGVEIPVSGEDMELAVTNQVEEVRAGISHEMTLGLLNLSPAKRSYGLTVSSPWQVQMTPESVEDLKSGDVALIKAVVEVPEVVGMGASAEIKISARDLLHPMSLQREAMVVLKVSHVRVRSQDDGDSSRVGGVANLP